jgi:Mrp family chromosome partitioning ATPase
VSILEIETEIELLENPPGGEDIEGLTDEEIAAARAIVSETIDTLSDELRPLRIERDTRLTLFEDALADLDDLERAGPPPPLLETLDVIAPFQISEKLYNLRLKQGGEGTNNFNITEVDDGSGGGLRLGDTVSNPVVRVGLGLLAGMLVGIGAVLMHLRFDPRLRTKAEIEEAFDLPVLAEIPKFSGRDTKANELHAVSRGRSIVTESYRMVRSALLFARAVTAAPLTTVTSSVTNGNADDAAPGNGDGPAAGAGHELRVVMVTSPGPSEGKTTTTANMAVVLAEAGYEVLVVNCDYRLPKLHEYFGQPHSARRTVDTGIPGVTLIADVADPEARNPTAVVESQRALIRKARERYDVVLLDTAPLLATNDALSLLPVVDIVVLVAREGKTDREAATETVDLLRRRRANLAGVVVTGSSGFGRSRYYYKYRYGNYYDHGDDPTSAPGGEAQAATRSARAVVTTN